MFLDISYFIFISFNLFFIGLFGILLNRKSILIILMSIEVMLLAVNLQFLLFSVYLDDIYGQVFSLFVLTVAAAESAIGLAILVCYFKVHSSIEMRTITLLQG
ncbi:MAG: NADH-quinone oxidoreductase subunit NuoK [Phycisphaerae bacterium]|nr:NADH-quinone oxidoreductase subunit NuoK [Phycisphaerae bacterium]|tara:strand:- start:1638 stop:1946 length:309 start_codon:yes stop_codon:yes gene_type:complete